MLKKPATIPNNKNITKNIGFVEKNLSTPIPIKIPAIIGDTRSKEILKPIDKLLFNFVFLLIFYLNSSNFSFYIIPLLLNQFYQNLQILNLIFLSEPLLLHKLYLSKTL